MCEKLETCFTFGYRKQKVFKKFIHSTLKPTLLPSVKTSEGFCKKK